MQKRSNPADLPGEVLQTNVPKFRKLRCAKCGSFLGWRNYSSTGKDVMRCRRCKDFVEIKETK